MILRRMFLRLGLATAVILAVAHQARAEADYQDARDMVSNLSNQAVQVMTSKGISDAERIEKFRTLFISSVDMPSVGKFVMSRYWEKASPDQQKDFMKLFEDMLVYTWSTRFREGAENIAIKVVSAKAETNQTIKVETQIVRVDQDPIPVFWKLRQTADGLKIADLLIEGTSMLLTYREEYASVLNQNAGKVDALLDILRKKTTEMAAAQGKAG